MEEKRTFLEFQLIMSDCEHSVSVYQKFTSEIHSGIHDERFFSQLDKNFIGSNHGNMGQTRRIMTGDRGRGTKRRVTGDGRIVTGAGWRTTKPPDERRERRCLTIKRYDLFVKKAFYINPRFNPISHGAQGKFAPSDIH